MTIFLTVALHVGNSGTTSVQTLPAATISGQRSVQEGGGAQYTVRLSRTATARVTVDWAVTGSGDTPAVAADFPGGVLPSGTLTFTPGDIGRSFSVRTRDDRTVEEAETFMVTLAPGN